MKLGDVELNFYGCEEVASQLVRKMIEDEEQKCENKNCNNKPCQYH
jgi:hypothetical protein